MSTNDRKGRYINCDVPGESFKAFLPAPLPPIPLIDLSALQQLIARASSSLGKLEGVSQVLPDSHLLLYYYIRTEAVLSSQIEGTQSSLSDLLLFECDEAPTTPVNDVVEVSCYVAALEHGLKRIKEGFPLSLRLIREMHEILLSKGRGSNKQPGEFRTSQNWIGGTRPGNAQFVPPPPEYLMECLDHFEKYLHAEDSPLPAIVNAGLIHLQFETIHPFLDGNGRIGRLLITFYLIVKGELSQPWLYLSLFFKNNREDYYYHLNAVREKGDWENWLEFFLSGIAETADQAVRTSNSISALFAKDKQKIATLDRASNRASQVHGLLSKRAIIGAIEAANQLDMSIPTARAALKNLKELGIVEEAKGKGKGKLFFYRELVTLLTSGTQPIA